MADKNPREDNIDEPVNPVDPIDPIETSQGNHEGQENHDQLTINEMKLTPPKEFYNLVEATEVISAKYNKSIPDIRFTPASQIVDGCTVEFSNDATGAILASGRLRFRNKLHIDNSTGELLVQVHISEITYSRNYVTIKDSNSSPSDFAAQTV
jgi:hypothetical protein